MLFQIETLNEAMTHLRIHRITQHTHISIDSDFTVSRTQNTVFLQLKVYRVLGFIDRVGEFMNSFDYGPLSSAPPTVDLWTTDWQSPVVTNKISVTMERPNEVKTAV